MELQSALTCPICGQLSIEAMPMDACVYFHECKGCGTRLKPKPGIAACFAPMVRSPIHQGKKLVIVFVQTRSAIRSS